jgi:hypothetical protein
MENIIENLNKDIKKVVGSFIKEDQLVETLKKRLTKKEFKFYKARCEELSKEQMCEVLKCDEVRLEELEKQTILKLNQEKIKKEILEF